MDSDINSDSNLGTAESTASRPNKKSHHKRTGTGTTTGTARTRTRTTEPGTAEPGTPKTVITPGTPVSVEKNTSLKPDDINVNPVNVGDILPGLLDSIGTDKTVASTTAIVLIGIIDGLATSMIGEDAKMTPSERDLIQAPLARIIGRMDATSLAVVSQWADPIMLAVGLSVWGLRIAVLAKAKEPPKTQDSPKKDNMPEIKPEEPLTPGGDGTGIPVNILAGFRGEHLQ